MSILTYQTTREEFLNKIKSRSKSQNSFNIYSQGLKKWDQYLESINLTDMEALDELKKNATNPDAYRFLDRYVTFLANLNIKRKTINLHFAVLRSWCAANGVMLFNEYVKRFVSLPKDIRETRVSLNSEIIKGLVNNAPRSMAAVLVVLLSSGMRISEVLQLRVKDIDMSTNPVTIHVRAETTKTREERIAFMSSEAKARIAPFLLGKEQNDMVFYKDEYSLKLLWSFEVRFGRLRKQLGYVNKYADNRTYHVNIHAFRAYFLTQATKILDGDIAHALIGHHKYLDVYLRLDEEERSKMYHKLEPYVTVSDEYRQKMIIAEKDKQLEKMKEMEQKILKLEAYNKRQQSKHN